MAGGLIPPGGSSLPTSSALADLLGRCARSFRLARQRSGAGASPQPGGWAPPPHLSQPV